MIVYHLLAKVEEKPMKLAVKQEKRNQYLTSQKTHFNVSQMPPNMQKVPQGHCNGTTRTINVSKTENFTHERANTVDTETDKDLNRTWEYYNQTSHSHFNVSPPHYSRMKLADDSEYTPEVPALAKVFHHGTPRFDIFFLKVDNKITLTPEYFYVSMCIYTFF